MANKSTANEPERGQEEQEEETSAQCQIVLYRKRGPFRRWKSIARKRPKEMPVNVYIPIIEWEFFYLEKKFRLKYSEDEKFATNCSLFAFKMVYQLGNKDRAPQRKLRSKNRRIKQKVSKYVGENTQLLASENITSTSTPVTHHDASCFMDEEHNEFLSRITSDEWEMADKVFWATCYPDVSSFVSTSSLATVQNQAGMNVVTSTLDIIVTMQLPFH
ncbi:hypothetical protein E3N88_26555 [Mikania micrantha]|uniref:Uncharacterized protein n=1 Tax=Mikania micrantha TaxID=192012 RepID=A0A5N6MVM7_9ASTR|nr:hypothetical protein E3N88_26555 [Mikania micrantha]